MKAIERRQEILKLLEAMRSLTIKELAEKLEVSTMTIRRDLNIFSQQGLITLTHGSAVLNSGGAFFYNQRFRRKNLQPEKSRIGQYCASLVKEGYSIFINCGSTTEEIAGHLIDRKNIVVLTDSLPAANILSAAKEVKLLIAPGEYVESINGFIGELTNEFIRRFTVDILFLAGTGVHSKSGVTTASIVDAETKRALVRQARKVVLAMDHTKMQINSLVSVADLSELSMIVTNKEADPKLLEHLRGHGVEIILV